MTATWAPLNETPTYTVGDWYGNATDVYDCDWIVETIKGWSEPPTVTGTTVSREFDDGEDAGDVYYGARFIMLSGTTIARSRAAMVAAKDRFAAVASGRSGATLIVAEAHLTRMCVVHRDGGSSCEDMGPAKFRWEFTLRASDPRRYDVTTSSAGVAAAVGTGGLPIPLTFPLDFGASSPANRVTLTNTGTWRTPLRAVFSGPYISPGLTSEAAGRSLDFDLTLASGDQLTVDTGTREVLLQGTSSRLYTIRPGSQWFQLVPGPNDLRVNGDGSSGGRVDLTYQSAWI